MARPLDLDELLEHFTLADDELELLRNKSGATRLGFSLLLRHLAWKGRFPRGRGEIPDNAVDHVARQVGVPPEELGLYDWSGRQSKRHRVEVRQHLTLLAKSRRLAWDSSGLPKWAVRTGVLFLGRVRAASGRCSRGPGGHGGAGPPGASTGDR